MLRGSLAAAITDASIAAHNPPEPQRRAAVIGGGLAGCAAARALAERGWQVTLFERNASLADETSGNLAGAVYPKFSVHETPQNRWYRDSYLYALARLPAVLGEPDGHSWARCGLLQLPATANSGDTRICEAVTASGRWPETVVQHVDAPAASRLTGAALESGGLWFAGAAWVHPPALCRALATHPRITLRLNTAVNSLTHADAGMLANDERCDIAVIANALAANTFAQTADLPLRRVRGQVTHLTATPASSAWRAVVCHEGYVTPARDGVHCAGATFAPRDHDPSVRHDDHAENLGNLAAACPQMYAALGGEQCRVSGGRTGFRAQTPDYLPVIGGVAAITGCGSDAGIARVPGLFVLTALGAKGIAFSLLGAEIIAALASGEPLPVDSEVADAIDPARFLRRKQRKEAAAKQASTRINKPDAGATP
jgi:tRNA 5-methylaminomethyl-2-thiouridine biosynthesis bifunctional protein